jgi:DNA polymerase III alpha subunit
MDSNAHIDFANIKAGKKEAHYDFGLREVTENTFGLLVYQEQIMKSVVVLGGFSLVESDLMRTVMKKKDVVTLNSYKEKFIDGATSRGCEPKEAEKIWLKLLAFSAYGFNRSHALAYSLISYQSQWLKYNYPLEFWTSSLNFADEKTISNKVAELNKLKQGISLVPPDINYSDLSFTCNVEFKEIYWSLSQIKNLGEAVVRNIIDERDKNGFFTSYHDFISRMPKKNCNKKHVACLILVGAFDKIEHINNPEERKFLLEKHYNITQTQLPEEYVGLNDDKRYFWVLLQKSLVGYGDISYKDVLMQNKNGKKYIEYYVSYQRFLKCADYTEVLVAGIVINIFIKTTKKGDKMVVLILQHNNVEIEIVIWNDFYERNNEFLDNCKGMMMAFFGKIRYDNKYKMCNKVNSTEDSFIIKL